LKQRSFGDLGFESKRSKRTRKQQFLDEMEVAVPWVRIKAKIKPHYHRAGSGRGRPQMPLSAMLRIHFMQQWFGYSDPAMEEALYDIPMLRAFAGLDAFEDHLPDETTILRFRHLLEKNDLADAIFDEVQAVLLENNLLPSVTREARIDCSDQYLVLLCHWVTPRINLKLEVYLLNRSPEKTLIHWFERTPTYVASS